MTNGDSIARVDSMNDEYIPISAELEMLKMRLEPLRHVESMLISKLAPPCEDEATRLYLVPSSSISTRSQVPSENSNGRNHSHKQSIAATGNGSIMTSRSIGHDHEVFVRSGYSWKQHLAKGSRRLQPSSRPNSADASFPAGRPDYVTELLHACQSDLIQLWRDPAVREILRKRRIRLEESPGL